MSNGKQTRFRKTERCGPKLERFNLNITPATHKPRESVHPRAISSQPQVTNSLPPRNLFSQLHGLPAADPVFIYPFNSVDVSKVSIRSGFQPSPIWLFYYSLYINYTNLLAKTNNR